VILSAEALALDQLLHHGAAKFRVLAETSDHMLNQVWLAHIQRTGVLVHVALLEVRPSLALVCALLRGVEGVGGIGALEGEESVHHLVHDNVGLGTIGGTEVVLLRWL